MLNGNLKYQVLSNFRGVFKILYSLTKQRVWKIKDRYQGVKQQFCGVFKMKALNTKLFNTPDY